MHYEKVYFVSSCFNCYGDKRQWADFSLPGYKSNYILLYEKSGYTPLSYSMPYDVMISYIACDSAAKHGTKPDLDAFLGRQTYNDTIRYIMRYLYQMIDFDPVRYAVYKNQSRHIGKEESLPPGIMEEELLYTLKKYIPNFGDYLLVRSHIIAHIRVTDTISVFDDPMSLYPRSMLVTSEIIDTIKGQVIPSCVNLYPNSKTEEKQSLYSEDCLQFEYALDWPRGEMDDEDVVIVGHDGYPWTGTKPKLIDSTGIPWTIIDREYMVFLHFVIYCDTEETDGKLYYSLWPSGYGSLQYGIYPIINGIVQDPENDFGFGTGLTTSAFKTALRTRINEIINYNGE